MPERPEVINRFLHASGWEESKLEPLTGDASFRRYVRLHDNGRRAILMDAPPRLENVRPFVRMAHHLRRLGLSAPAILAADESSGLLLLEDFGDDTFSRLLDLGGDERSLYALAVDVLVYLHHLPADRAIPSGLPRYDQGRFIDEALLFADWYLPAIHSAPVNAELRRGYAAAWSKPLQLVLAEPVALVIRDFHVDNLMQLRGRDGLAACGVLDFQDAVAGPAAYDLVSLLQDARRDVAESVRAEMAQRYKSALGLVDISHFESVCAILAAQRHAKVLGIFTRLHRRDGKPGYLQHLPRVWRLLEANLVHPALAPVAQWFEKYVPMNLRCQSSAMGYS